MKTIFISILLLCSMCKFSSSQTWQPNGGRSSAMANASVALSDGWSVHNNQAGMASLRRPEACIFIDNHYLLKELNYEAIALNLPCRLGVFGSSIEYSGNAAFNSSLLGLAYARKFGQQFSAGIQLDLLQTKLSENYGSHLTGTFEAGLQLELTNSLVLGAHLFNAPHIRLGTYNDERIPCVMNAGICYSYSGNFLLTAEVRKSSDCPTEVLTGLEYRFFNKGLARIGIASSPFRYSFGTGYRMGHLSIDISSTYHTILGFSPQASIQYAFGKQAR